jgi:ATP adenylyltransferase/5',5'''-P-1,P-4-tetraphosphate phosphorylase II
MTMFVEMNNELKDGVLHATDDDLDVFEKIRKKGVGSFSAWERIEQGEWELLYNPMRAMRPERASAEKVENIFRQFSSTKFHFNKPFLRPEILWEAEWNNFPLRVLYNKFPFAPYHLIIVPYPEKELPQYLTKDEHGLIWQLVAEQADVFTGFGVGYNSLGACASVNQLHFQSFVQEEKLPIEKPLWAHNGGRHQYPMHCIKTISSDECWTVIEQFHAENQPYNLLYRKGCCYVLPRQMQGSEQVAERVHGAGWIEECGVFNVSSKNRAKNLTAEFLYSDLKSLSVES